MLVIQSQLNLQNFHCDKSCVSLSRSIINLYMLEFQKYLPPPLPPTSDVIFCNNSKRSIALQGVPCSYEVEAYSHTHTHTHTHTPCKRSFKLCYGSFEESQACTWLLVCGVCVCVCRVECVSKLCVVRMFIHVSECKTTVHECVCVCVCVCVRVCVCVCVCVCVTEVQISMVRVYACTIHLTPPHTHTHTPPRSINQTHLRHFLLDLHSTHTPHAIFQIGSAGHTGTLAPHVAGSYGTHTRALHFTCHCVSSSV